MMMIHLITLTLEHSLQRAPMYYYLNSFCLLPSFLRFGYTRFAIKEFS